MHPESMRVKSEGDDCSWICKEDADGYVEHRWRDKADRGDLCWCGKESYPYCRRKKVKLELWYPPRPRRKNAKDYTGGCFEEIDFSKMTPLDEVFWFLDALTDCKLEL